MGKNNFIRKNKREFYITILVCGIIIFVAVLWSIGYSLSTNRNSTVVTSEDIDIKKENKYESIKKENSLEDHEKSNKNDKESEKVKNEDEKLESEDEKLESENLGEQIVTSSNNDNEFLNNTSDEALNNNDEVLNNNDEALNNNDEILNSSNEEKEIVDTHEHIWENIVKEVYHKEEGHFEEVLVKEEVVNEVPIYDFIEKNICNTCGSDITGSDINTHIKEHNSDLGYSTETVPVQIGTNNEVTPAVYEKKWIVDKAARNETVVTGKKCKTCGITE